MVERKKYNIGLDIGTESVGWAVINEENFKVMRKGNKSLWGVRLFDSAETAEKRRLFRSSRKRYDRRRQRIKLLQEEFKQELDLVDYNFITKLHESKFYEDDKINKSINLTDEEKKLIKEYNHTYPTIYHLRSALIKNEAPADIRLIYLAIHHIIKYRGNFLYGNSSFKLSDINIRTKLEDFISQFSALKNNDDLLIDLDYEKLELALFSESKNDKKKILEKEFSKIFASKISKELVKALIGDKFSISNLFEIELEENISISFKGSDYEDNLAKIDKALNENIELLETLKELYDSIFLKNLFKGSNADSISLLMVEKYNNYHNDLLDLKKIYRLNKHLYHEMFKSQTDKGEIKLCEYEKFAKNKIDYDTFTKKILNDFEILYNDLKDEELLNTIKEIKLKIENGSFMPKITSVENGKYPYQLNKDELIKIIDNYKNVYPFLGQKLNDGTYKLVRLLEFRIPYYVGPLNNTTDKKDIVNPNFWLKKAQNNVKITPYNFNEVIDLESSAQEFIERMIGNCTYLLQEKAMPSNSILYSKFKVLNELKQIKIGDVDRQEKLTLDMQKKIYNELFLKTSGTITDRKFKDYLLKTNELPMVENLIVTGYSADNKFANNMQSYIDFFDEDGIFKDTNYNLDDAEEIIRLITVFEDKDILETKVKREFPALNEEALKKIRQKRYKGWSNLSKTLLTDLTYEDKKTNTFKSIMTLMEETEENFMQIINNKEYNFDKKISDFNNKDRKEALSYDLVKDLATSPATKRGIYQALKVVKEIVDYMGYEPEEITLEMARGDEAKKRTDDRKKKIEDLYQKWNKDIENYNKLKAELSGLKKLDNEKLFLYFIQEGKSLYSKTPLDINDLDKYEVDHIIPRTLIKDNSLDNKALVLREENQLKAASYVLPQSFRNPSMKGWWQHLKKIGLISSKKYNNLCRYKFDEKSIEGFINRQLVETRQICKHTANILGNVYKNTEIVYLPASLSHNYRMKFELFKFRELNNYHHAHDAYLAAVLGEYKTKYLKTSIDFDKLKELNKKLYEEKRYYELNSGYVINSLDESLNDYFINNETGEVFNVHDFNKNIEDTLYRNDILISKKTEINTGELFKQTIQSKGKEGACLKEGMDPLKYGSYTSITPAYACMIKYKTGNKEKQKLVGIPIYIDIQSQKDDSKKINYLKDLMKIDTSEELEIIKDKIPFNSLLDCDGKICYLVGATDKVEVCNAKEFNIDKANLQKWKYSLARLLNGQNKLVDDVVYSNNLSEIILYIINKVKSEYVLYQDLVDKMNEMFGSDKLEKITLENKEKIIKEMLNLLKANSRTADMKFLNNSSEFGRKKSKVIDNVKIINNSPTGIYSYIDSKCYKEEQL